MDSFQTRSTLACGDAHCTWWSLPALGARKNRDMQELPISIRILLENLLRNEDGSRVCREHVEQLCGWSPEGGGEGEIPFLPSRVLMQDFTGVPAVVDLAAMRDALVRLGGDADSINPRIPVDLVVDHSVQVERFGCADAFAYNAEKEMERNRERYTFLKWGQHSFSNFRVVPPATGICHQVNLEYLAGVVTRGTENGRPIVYPDTLVGLDSHTTMINGAGVLGWGVGGIEAEAAILGQPCYLPVPRVIGFELSGRLRPEATATDLVLTITRMLREKGVVGSFVEFFGEGLDGLGIADRATIANMTPEFGATSTYFPVDAQTLRYLAFTGRSSARIADIETYLRAQGLFRTPDMAAPRFSETLHLDLAVVEPVLAGPKRPQDQIALGQMKETFARDFEAICRCSEPPAAVRQRWEEEGGAPAAPQEMPGKMVLRKPFDASDTAVIRPYSSFVLEHGTVVIAAITSCTNTSNPSVLLGAGIMARKAVERGLQVRPWVKASLAPGSRVVTEYLRAAGLMPYLQALRFHLVAYGCTTCIGNSGALQSDVARAVEENKLVVASVLSGNRNYEGRINPLVRANYLASPMLVVAYALAGTVNIDLETQPLGHNPNNEAVYLRDIWPGSQEIAEAGASLVPEMFTRLYATVDEGDAAWRALSVAASGQYSWDENSTYIKRPPFFADLTRQPPERADITSARVLVFLGDSITTDHISPAGAIAGDSPAGRYLQAQGVVPADFNSYGARRGNHEVMMRGTFANPRLQNFLVPEVEGGWTRHLPGGETMTVYDAAVKYGAEGTPLIVIAGKEYGSGSSRDWAAKGPRLLGVRVVLAESFERIHRSNLVAMGVLPLEFAPGESAGALGLTGRELFFIERVSQGLSPRQNLRVLAEPEAGEALSFAATARLDSQMEVRYYENGGILPYILRRMAP